MQRRLFISLAIVMSVVLISGVPAEAHHGWSSYDLSRPVYIVGTVVEVVWQNPHVEVFLDVTADIRLPANLAQTPIPDFLERVGGRETLRKARLPSQPAKRWTLELAPISRMIQYGATRRAQVGERVAFVGYISRTVCNEIRAEIVIFSDGETQGLRNSPLPHQEPQPNPCNPDLPEARPALSLNRLVEMLLQMLRALQ